MGTIGFNANVVKVDDKKEGDIVIVSPTTGGASPAAASTALAVTVAPETTTTTATVTTNSTATKDVVVSAVEMAAVNGFIQDIVLGERIALPTVTVSEVTVMDEFGKPLPTSRKAVFKPALEKEIQDANIMAFMGQGKFQLNASQKDALENENTGMDQFFPTYNGLGVLKHMTINDCLFRSIIKAENMPGLEPRSEFLTVDITHRIPIELLRDFMANAKAIYEMHKTEFAAQFYRRPDGSYYVYYPTQKVFAAHVDYSADENAKFKLRATDQLIMEVHSHANMGAFFSGGDNANEKSPCFYAVVGGFGGSVATAIARAKYLDFELQLALTDIFDFNGASLEDMMALSTLAPASPAALATAKTGASMYGGVTTTTYGGYNQRPYAASSNWGNQAQHAAGAGWWQKDKRVGGSQAEQEEWDDLYGYWGTARQTKRQQRQAAMASKSPKPTLSVELNWLLDLIPDNAINLAIVQLNERKLATERGATK